PVLAAEFPKTFRQRAEAWPDESVCHASGRFAGGGVAGPDARPYRAALPISAPQVGEHVSWQSSAVGKTTRMNQPRHGARRDSPPPCRTLPHLLYDPLTGACRSCSFITQGGLSN